MSPIELAPGVRMAHVPGRIFGFPQGNNVYLLGERGATLVDTGLPGPTGEERLTALFAAAGRHAPERLVLTHAHHDHCGSWPWLRERHPGMRLLVHPDEDRNPFGGLPDGAPVEPISDLERLDLDGVQIEIVATPGHSAGHVVVHLPALGLLLTGDLIVGEGTSWVGPPGGSLVDYLASLERVRAIPGLRRLLPAHGPIVDDPVGKVDEYLEHRAMRERQVLECLDAGLGEVPAMVAKIYVGYPDEVMGVAAITVLGHLEKLEHEGRIRREGAAGDVPAVTDRFVRVVERP